MTPNILPLVMWPDPLLNTVCERVAFPTWSKVNTTGNWTEANVTLFRDSLEQFRADMFATMKTFKGIGLAAPQVGVLVRIIALEVEQGRPYFFINPEVVEVDKDRFFKWEEGCLSVPGYFEERIRPQRIVVKYQGIHGGESQMELQGLSAFAMQHELDHLDGKLFVDDLSPLKKQRVRDKIRKTLRG